MSKDLEIKDVNIASDSLYKSQKIKLGNHVIRTPIKANDLRLKIQGISTDHKNYGICEYYKVFNSKRIQNILSGDREEIINREVARVFQPEEKHQQAKICFSEFEEPKIPNKTEIEFMTDLSYVHSDITPVPLLPRFTRQADNAKFGDKQFTNYLEFVDESLEIIETLNHKPIMGVLPLGIPSIFLPSLIKYYSKKGINSICLDFQGTFLTGNLTKVRRIIRTLKSEKILEHLFTYNLNLSSGRLSKDELVMPARDIVSFGYGFDALGGQHIRKRLPPEVWKRILSSKQVIQNSLRIFNKEDYGYYKVQSYNEIKKVYPKDSHVPIGTLAHPKLIRTATKLFNQEQQGAETNIIIKKLDDSREMIPYLSKKKNIENKDIKNIINIRKKK